MKNSDACFILQETVLELEKENKMQDNSCENVILHGLYYIIMLVTCICSNLQKDAAMGY